MLAIGSTDTNLSHLAGKPANKYIVHGGISGMTVAKRLREKGA